MLSQNKLLFYFPFNRLVWKILIDQSSSVLVVELRDDENREVNFAAIDLTSKEQLWSKLPTQENWWLGLEEIGQGLVILHGYKDIQNPEHQGVYLFDLRSGKSLGENKDYTFFDFMEDNLIVYDPKLSERVYHKLNTKGEIKEEVEEKNFIGMKKDVPLHIVNSQHYTGENKYFEKIAGFIEAFTGKKPELVIDYLEHNNKIIASFYFKENEKLVNYLFAVNEKGEILLEERIGEEIQGIGMDTFFLYKDLLIFVKNKKELVIFEL